MSNCLLNVVAQHLRFYYTVAESVKNSRDVVFIYNIILDSTSQLHNRKSLINDDMTDFLHCIDYTHDALKLVVEEMEL